MGLTGHIRSYYIDFLMKFFTTGQTIPEAEPRDIELTPKRLVDIYASP
jgi:hypothetical protein